MVSFNNVRQGVKYYVRGIDGKSPSFVGTFKSFVGGDFEFVSDGQSIFVNPQDVEEISPLSGGKRNRRNSRKNRKSRKSRNNRKSRRNNRK